MAIRLHIQPSGSTTPAIWRGFAVSLGRLIDRWIASIIASREREAALVVLRDLGDRELKDIGIYRCKIGDTLSEIARDRTWLQRCRRSS